MYLLPSDIFFVDLASAAVSAGVGQASLILLGKSLRPFLPALLGRHSILEKVHEVRVETAFHHTAQDAHETDNDQN